MAWGGGQAVPDMKPGVKRFSNFGSSFFRDALDGVLVMNERPGQRNVSVARARPWLGSRFGANRCGPSSAEPGNGVAHIVSGIQAPALSGVRVPVSANSLLYGASWPFGRISFDRRPNASSCTLCVLQASRTWITLLVLIAISGAQAGLFRAAQAEYRPGTGLYCLASVGSTSCCAGRVWRRAAPSGCPAPRCLPDRAPGRVRGQWPSGRHRACAGFPS